MDYIEIFNNAKLKIETKKTYIDKMKRILELFNDIPTLNEFIKKDMTPSNRYLFCLTILAYRKHKGLERQQDWQNYFKELDKQIKLNDNKPSIKYKNNYLDFKVIYDKLDELENECNNDKNKSWMKVLLLAMYILIPPIRCNYGCVYFEFNDNKYLIEKKINHIFKNKIYLFNLKVKTDNHIVELPIRLIHIINKSLLQYPRNTLFDLKTNRQFSIYANNILKDIFKNNITLTLLRHIYINNLDMNKLTVNEKIEIAKKMNHSTGMQDKYRLLF
jgi:hypothetical protein